MEVLAPLGGIVITVLYFVIALFILYFVIQAAVRNAIDSSEIGEIIRKKYRQNTSDEDFGGGISDFTLPLKIWIQPSGERLTP